MSPWPAASTGLLALVGHPVRRSLSPLMHNAVLRELGLDCVYVALEVSPDRAGDVAPAIRTLGLRGANLTVPFKQTVLEHLDALAPSAARAGAVNTVVNEGGTLVGHNTDGEGLLQHLDAQGRPPIARAVVLGAGGTGCAVSAALRARGAAVVLLNRSPTRAEAAARRIAGVAPGPLTPDAFANAAADADLVVHCTAGRGEAIHRLDPHGFGGHTWVDVNYWAAEPPHRGALQARGVTFHDGRGMLAFQGAAALSLWTGRPIDGAAMAQALDAHAPRVAP